MHCAPATPPPTKVPSCRAVADARGELNLLHPPNLNTLPCSATRRLDEHTAPGAGHASHAIGISRFTASRVSCRRPPPLELPRACILAALNACLHTGPSKHYWTLEASSAAGRKFLSSAVIRHPTYILSAAAARRALVGSKIVPILLRERDTQPRCDKLEGRLTCVRPGGRDQQRGETPIHHYTSRRDQVFARVRTRKAYWLYLQTQPPPSPRRPSLLTAMDPLC